MDATIEYAYETDNVALRIEYDINAAKESDSDSETDEVLGELYSHKIDHISELSTVSYTCCFTNEPEVEVRQARHSPPEVEVVEEEEEEEEEPEEVRFTCPEEGEEEARQTGLHVEEEEEEEEGEEQLSRNRTDATEVPPIFEIHIDSPQVHIIFFKVEHMQVNVNTKH